MRRRDRIRVYGMVIAVVLGQAAASSAFPGGIASTSFGDLGCPKCHSGGVVPSVILSGPTTVPPGSTADYTLTIFGNSTQNFGGLNVAGSDGTLSIGGPFALDTRTIIGLNGLVEITHSAPEQGDLLNEIEFSFQWTAPAAYTTVTLRGWGNAVNHDGLSTGDNASLATLDIAASVSSVTPTPTPFVCGDAAPLDLPLIVDGGAQACQAEIAKAAALYVKNTLKAMRSCLKSQPAGADSSDALAACVGSATTAPTDATTAAAIATADSNARSLLVSKCSDAAVALLGACAATESGLETCLLAQHLQAIVDTVTIETGAAQSASKGPQHCQNALRTAANGYLVKSLAADTHCLVARNKAGIDGDGAPLCVGSLTDGVFVAPTDAKTAAEALAAQAKLTKTIQRKCDDADIAALAGCGTDRSSAIACLLCSHRGSVFGLVSGELGSTP